MMVGYTAVPTLMFVTLGIVLAIAIFLFLRMRATQPKHPMAHQKERNIDEIRMGVPPEKE